MERTLIAVFDNRGDAQSALDELIEAGFSRQQAALSAADPTGAPAADTAAGDSSIMGSIKHFLSTMFGTDNSEYVQKYSDAVTRGHHVLTLNVALEREFERASGIIERWGPVDIDETSAQRIVGALDSGVMRTGSHGQPQRAASMSKQSMQGAPGSTQGSMQGAAQSQVPSASMSGSQQRAAAAEDARARPAAQRSGGRVFEHLAEPPLNAALLTAADEAYFRLHYSSYYAMEGEQFDGYAPAYQYGASMAADDRHRGREWHEVVLQLKGEWEQRHPGSDWSRFEAAVRHGWQKMRG